VTAAPRWFRPVWPGVVAQEWHLLGAPTLDNSVRGACGLTWPLTLTHGGWETLDGVPREGSLHSSCVRIAEHIGIRP
jgi:hypothetical protein